MTVRIENANGDGYTIDLPIGEGDWIEDVSGDAAAHGIAIRRVDD